MAEAGSLKDSYDSYCTKKGEMTTKDLTKWFTDACVISKKAGDAFHSNNIDITFSSKKPKGKNAITYQLFDGLLDALCEKKSKDPKASKSKDEIKTSVTEKLSSTNKAEVTKKQTEKLSSKDAATARLTDTSKYTGAHKERFGADGQGKGKEGREDIHENTGYVGNYKGDGTYDKK